MLSQEELKKIIDRQDKYAAEVEKLQDQIEQMEFDMAELLHKIPAEDLHNKYFADSKDKKENPLIIFQRVAKFWLEQPQKAKEISLELNSYPEYNEFCEKQREYDNLKYVYFAKVYAYFKLIDNDRKKVFDKVYSQLVDSLADNGLFIYYQQTPDAPISGQTTETAERIIIEWLSEYDYLSLRYMLSQILAVDSTNELRNNKTNDLKEALACLINGAYQSCARTMFALLENEHTNASSLIKRSRGHERAAEIEKYVQDMGSDYYEKVWQKIDVYYKKLNCDTDKMEQTIINRNDLAHGTYMHIATSDDCIRLFLLYITFKELSFYLQRMVDFKNEFKKDSISYIVKEAEKLAKGE